jgi:hypothetical protein
MSLDARDDRGGGTGYAGPPSVARRGLRRAGRVLALGGVVLGVAAGSAFAYWRVNGTGGAAVSAGTLSAPTVQAFVGGDAPTSSLLPGGTSDVIVRVNNPNAYQITMTGISLNGTISAVGGIGTCTTTGVTTTFPSSLSVTVAAGSHLIDVSAAASMSDASPSGCQGATFEIPVAATFAK